MNLPAVPLGHALAPTDVLQLYRHLLRAATYLPDSVLRTYAHSYIRDRFISCRQKDKLTERISKYYKEGRAELRSLIRATRGDAPALEKIMQQTYGRRGKRRREFINNLLRSDEAPSHVDNIALEEFIHRAGQPKKSFTPSPKLVAFLESQRQNQPPEMTRSKIRRLSPQLEEKNIWGRRLPTKLEASKRAQFWAKTLDSILPPLPAHEWDRLRDLATGVIRCEKPPPRRKRGIVTTPRDISGIEWVTQPTEIANSTLELDEVTGILRWTPVGLYKSEETSHRFSLTQRALRRLWGGIWVQSSKMTQDESTKTWVITWGSGRGMALSGKATEPSAKDVELFEGLENVPKPEKPPRRRNKPKATRPSKQDLIAKAANTPQAKMLP